MESIWYTYVVDCRDLFTRLGKPVQSLIALCDEALERFENLQSMGYCIIMGDNQDKYIDEVWNDLFNQFGGKNITFKIDKSKDKDMEWARIALEKDKIKLVILNSTLWFIQGVMEKRNPKDLKLLNDKVYRNKSKDNLIETKREVKRLHIDGRMDDSFKNFNEHLQNQFDFLKEGEGHTISKPTIEDKINTNPNPYGEVFVGVDDKPFKLFESFSKNYIIAPFKDFSFIFQQMKSDGFIRDIKHLKFAKWAFDEKFIDEELYDKIQEEGQFWSLGKVGFLSRTKPYKTLKDKFFPSRS